MSEEKKANITKERKILYDFWDKLPERKIIVDYDENFFSHFARKLTFHFLGIGQKEKLEDSNTIIRRAFNAQEIYAYIHTMLDFKFKGKEDKKPELSLHSLYFHIQKLEEKGFIKTVAFLKEGRHNVAYYSRSAKVVLFKEEYEESEEEKAAFDAMKALSKVIDPEFNPEIFLEFYDEYKNIARESLDNIQRKLASYEQQINDANIDPNHLQNFFKILNSVNPKYQKLYKKIMDIINIELW